MRDICFADTCVHVKSHAAEKMTTEGQVTKA